MAHITKTAAGTYRARWRDADGRTVGKTFPTQREAKAHLVKVEGDLQRGTYVDPKRGRITLAAWVEEWTATLSDLRPSSLVTIDVAMRVHVLPAMGDRPLANITTDELRRLVHGLGQGVDGRKPLAPATVRNVGRHLSACLTAAVRAGRLTASPWVTGRGGIRLPAPTKRDFVLLPPDVVDQLAAVMPRRMAAMVPLAFGSGLRLGEMCGLRVGDIDGLPARRGHLAAVGGGGEVGPGLIRVRRQMTTPPSGPPVIGPLKTDTTSRRDVDVPAFVVGAVAEHIDVHGLGDEGLIFAARNGGGLRRTDLNKAWRKAREVVGTDARGWHDLRHNYATNLLSAGIAPPTAAAMLGHSVQMLLSTYGHALPNDRERARDVIGDLYTRSGVNPASIAEV